MAMQVTGRLRGASATFADYERLFQERPRKFSAAEVGYIPIASMPFIGLRVCGGCNHFFVNPDGPRKVCEIMRPPGEVPVSPVGSCRFWNRDGKSYPLLNVL